MAPKPGIIPLRPLAVGEILDGAVSYIRANPRAVLGIAAGLALISAILQMAISAFTLESLSTLEGLDPATGELSDAQISSLVSGSSTLLIGIVGLALLGVVASGLFITLVAAGVLGRPMSASEAWARTRGRLLPLLGLTLAIGLVTFGAFAGAAVLGVLSIGVLGAAGGFVMLAILAVATPLIVWLYIRLTLAPAALVIERHGVAASMRRSFALVKGSWWRVFGITVLASILTNIVSSVIALPATAVGSLFGADTTSGLGAQLFFVAVATLISATLTLPFSGGISGLLYVDMRIRREALDLRLQQARGDDHDPLSPFQA